MTNEIGEKLEERLKLAEQTARESEERIKAEAERRIKESWEDWRMLNKKATGRWCRRQRVKEMMQYSDFQIKQKTRPHQYQISDEIPYCGQAIGVNPQEDPVVEILYELGVNRHETLADLPEKARYKIAVQSQNYLKKISDRTLTEKEYYSILNGTEPILRKKMRGLDLNGRTPRRRISQEDLQSHLQKMGEKE